MLFANIRCLTTIVTWIMHVLIEHVTEPCPICITLNFNYPLHLQHNLRLIEFSCPPKMEHIGSCICIRWKWWLHHFPNDAIWHLFSIRFFVISFSAGRTPCTLRLHIMLEIDLRREVRTIQFHQPFYLKNGYMHKLLHTQSITLISSEMHVLYLTCRIFWLNEI